MAARAQRIAAQKVIDKLLGFAVTYDQEAEYYRGVAKKNPSDSLAIGFREANQGRADAYRVAANMVRDELVQETTPDV